MKSFYLAGAASKLIAMDATGAPLAPVFWLYLLNSVTVGCNGWLQWYLPRRAAALRRGRVARTRVATI